jgi:hypothetical protein
LQGQAEGVGGGAAFDDAHQEFAITLGGFDEQVTDIAQAQAAADFTAALGGPALPGGLDGVVGGGVGGAVGVVYVLIVKLVVLLQMV